MRTAEENIAAAVSAFLLYEGALSTPFAPGAYAATPIERHFYQALYIACSLPVSAFMRMQHGGELEPLKIGIEAQYKLFNWKIDYVISVPDGDDRLRRLAVECDGHDFHERTKEQAIRDRARDRQLQEAGVTVFRFTGSELYRDAFGCARQVLKWAENTALATSR